MKTIKFIAAAAVAASIFACSPKGANAGAQAGADSLGTVKPVNPKSLLPSKSMKDSVSYLLGINFGSYIKGYQFGEDFNFNEIVKGIKDFIKAEGNPRDSSFLNQFKINPNEMNVIFGPYIEKVRGYNAAIARGKEVEFLAANKKKEGVTVTESGLQYIIREAGAEEKIGPKDTVYAHYKGTLPDGSVFDEVEESAPAISFALNRVIKGWTEGLQLIGEGGKINLVIPSELGYGENGTQGIDPNTPLTFEVAVDSVKRFVEKTEE